MLPGLFNPESSPSGFADRLFTQQGIELKRNEILLLLVILLALPCSAQDVPCPHFATIAAARAAEKSCHEIASKFDMSECLECVSEWWYHFGGALVDYSPYGEITRIIRDQLKLNPSDIDLISELMFFTYSIETSQIGARESQDYTATIADVLDDFERPNSDRYEYFQGLMYVPMLIVMHKQFGTDSTKRRYYAVLKHQSGRADTLWHRIDHDDYSLDVRHDMKTHRRFVRQVLDRYQHLDTAVTDDL